ncbi:MAG TPA: PepSY domain-containing protein, partial [Thermoanaerobaculia bacterium]|nr:PepSY domain-containing protein [Thermoanaerobaculia bacterium]
MKTHLATIGLSLALGLLPLAAHADKSAAAEQAKLQKEAKISLKHARKIALEHVKRGTIESSELERENGKLIYSFDIHEAGRH